MTVKYMEGFDQFPVGDASGALNTILSYAGWGFLGDINGVKTGVKIVQPGRYGYGKALQLSPTLVTGQIPPTFATLTVPGTDGEKYISMACLFAFIPNNLSVSFNILDSISNTVMATLQFLPNGVVSIAPTGGTTLFSSPNAFILNSYFNVEIHYKTSATTGILEVRINTIPVISALNINTSVSGVSNPVTTTYQWATSGGNTNVPVAFTFDDFSIVTAGGLNNASWLGLTRVQTGLPNGSGATTQFNPSNSGLANWQNVLNANVDDSLYVNSSVVGNQDLYTVSPVVNLPPIFAVGVSASYRQDDATQRFYQSIVKSGATTLGGTPRACNQGFATTLDIFELDPNTGLAWSATAVNSLQIGPKVNA